MKDKVKNRIDNYLEFDSDDLFKQGDAVIFGGAVRDSIAEQKIHDIDIMCGPITSNFLHSLLEEKGYKYMPKLSSKEITNLYHGISIIAEPRTYINGNGKTIQVIRPSGFGVITSSDYNLIIKDCISNVDISCCGVSYDGDKIEEHYKNAILHCSCKIFFCNHNAKMTIESRLVHRRIKMEERGWKEFRTKGEEAYLIREGNLDKLVND